MAYILKDVSTGTLEDGNNEIIGLKKKTWIKLIKYNGNSNWIFEYGGKQGNISEHVIIGNNEFMQKAKAEFEKEQENIKNAEVLRKLSRIDSLHKAELRVDSIKYARQQRESDENNRRLDNVKKVNEQKRKIALKNERIKAEAEKIKRENEEKERYNNNIKKFGLVNATRIKQKQIWIGMTDEMAKESIGAPGKINKTVTALGVSEQWVYRYKDLYLYFDNGKLTSWQE